MEKSGLVEGCKLVIELCQQKTLRSCILLGACPCVLDAQEEKDLLVESVW